MQLNQLATRDEIERDNGLWLADEQDAEGIAEPVSSFLARRGGPGVVNPDVGDFIAALVAIFAYLSKQLSLRAQLRRLRAAGAMVDDLADVPAEPAPPGL